MKRATKTASSPSRHLTWIAVGFLAALLIGDRMLAGARLPKVYGTPNGPLWKYALYEEAAQPPDVVFIGCSYALNGISPATVDAEVAGMLGRPVRSLNLSASATSTLTEHLVVRRMLESGRPRPQVVYLGVSEQNTNTCNHKWMVNGLRALGDVRDVPLAWSGGASLFVEGLMTSVFRGYYQWTDCRTIAERFITAVPLTPMQKTRTDAQGWGEWMGHARARTDPKHLSDLAKYYAAQAAQFRSGNPNDLALRRAIEELRDAGVGVRLVELPLLSVIADMVRPEVAEAYEAFIGRVASDMDVKVIRAPAGLVCDEDFFDAWHLTADGARKFSRWLATDVADALRRTETAP